MKKKKWLFVVLWFALLFIWNFTTGTKADDFLVSRCIFAIELMLAPIKIIVSILVLIVIFRYPLRKAGARGSQ
jgi:hypothetical protein